MKSWSGEVMAITISRPLSAFIATLPSLVCTVCLCTNFGRQRAMPTWTSSIDRAAANRYLGARGQACIRNSEYAATMCSAARPRGEAGERAVQRPHAQRTGYQALAGQVQNSLRSLSPGMGRATHAQATLGASQRRDEARLSSARVQLPGRSAVSMEEVLYVGPRLDV